jgi:hypothetical protein
MGRQPFQDCAARGALVVIVTGAQRTLVSDVRNNRRVLVTFTLRAAVHDFNHIHEVLDPDSEPPLTAAGLQ